MSIQKITKIALFIAVIAAFEPLCWGAANPEREMGVFAQLYKEYPDVGLRMLESLGQPELKQLMMIGHKERQYFPNLYEDAQYAMDELIKREIKQLLQQHKGNAQAALFDAAKNNKAWAIDYLVKNGAKVNAKEGSGWAPLMFAANRGHEAVVARLLAVAGVDVNAKNEYDRTALWYAMQGHYGAVVTQLIAAGADFDDLELQELKDIGVEIGG